jgi:hypothetical protein
VANLWRVLALAWLGGIGSPALGSDGPIAEHAMVIVSPLAPAAADQSQPQGAGSERDEDSMADVAPVA